MIGEGAVRCAWDRVGLWSGCGAVCGGLWCGWAADMWLYSELWCLLSCSVCLAGVKVRGLWTYVPEAV